MNPTLGNADAGVGVDRSSLVRIVQDYLNSLTLIGSRAVG